MHGCVARPRGGNAPPPPSLLSPPGPGSVRLCSAMETELPNSPSLPTLLASCEIADSHPNQTFCPRRNCCQVLTEIAGQAGTNFSHSEEKKSTQCTYTVQTISWLLLSFPAESSASGPQSRKAPYHSLPLPPLVYIYISEHDQNQLVHVSFCSLTSLQIFWTHVN